MNTPYTKEQFLSLREKMDAITVDEDTITEDDADDAKFNILNQIIPGVETVIELVDELEKLDREDGASGQMDLMDQITTMRKSLASMLAVVQRSMHIVPPKGGLKY
jgi:hypothetical protein